MLEMAKEKSANLSEFAAHVEAAMKVIEKYENSKPSMMAFTKLEEAMLWMQVVILNVKQVDEKKEVETPDAA
jgi:hypothetical protein